MAAYTQAEILQQFDSAATGFDFFDFDNGYYYPITARINLFRDEIRWAMVVEQVGFGWRGGNVHDILHFFGNCVEGPLGAGQNEDFLGRIDDIDIDDLLDFDEAETPRHDPNLTVRGRVVVVRGAFTDPVDMFRALGETHRGELLADDIELRRRIPQDLPRFLTIDEWHQPDLVESVPSATDTFVAIARALVSGRPEDYVPSATPNTHWSNWPEAGTL